MPDVGLGLTLCPDGPTMALLEPLFWEEVDYAELCPETTWKEGPDGALVENAYGVAFRALLAAADLPCVAHGVGMNLCGADDEAHQERWLARARLDQAQRGYRWWTEHWGLTRLAGEEHAVPAACLLDEETHQRAAAALDRMAAIVPLVGIENSVFYHRLQSPLDEPPFFRRLLAAPHRHLLLDLHNLYTDSLNFDFDPADWLAQAPLDRVIELHISGGSWAPAAWSPRRGKPFRLDSHDEAVPEPVWALLQAVLPRCPRLRGLTLERIEGSVSADTVPLLRAELRRARALLEAR